MDMLYGQFANMWTWWLTILSTVSQLADRSTHRIDNSQRPRHQTEIVNSLMMEDNMNIQSYAS